MKSIFIRASILLSLVCAYTLDMSAVGFTVSKYIVCKGDSALFKDTTTPPTGTTIVLRAWDFGGNPASTTLDSIFHVFPSTDSNTIKLTVYFSNGDSATYSDPTPVVVKELPTATITTSLPMTCPSVNIVFAATQTIGDGLIVSDTVDYDDGFMESIYPSAAKNYNYTALGKYNVYYRVRDQYGCIAEARTVVTIISPPIVRFEKITPSCRDTIVYFENRTKNPDSFLANQWVWTFFDSLGTSQIPGGPNNQYIWRKGGPHWVVLYGKDKLQCEDYSDTLFFQVDTTPKLQIIPLTYDSMPKSLDTIICFGESLQYTVRGSDTLFYSPTEWLTKIKGDSVILVTPKSSITYKVYGKTPNCPATSKDINITVVPPIQNTISVDPNIILKGNNAQLVMQPNAVYDSIIWWPDSSVQCRNCDSNIASPIQTTMYHARVYYSIKYKTCTAEDSILLKVDDACVVDSFDLATAFTPNGDGRNDVFYLKAYSIRTVNEMNIYNRWGNKVYGVSEVAANKKEFGWNGRMNNNGDDLPPGLYIYNISATCANRQKINFQGEINLLR